jgi:hypothetical protein
MLITLDRASSGPWKLRSTGNVFIEGLGYKCVSAAHCLIAIRMSASPFREGSQENNRCSASLEQRAYLVLVVFTLLSVVAILLALEISVRILFPKIGYVGESRSSLWQWGKFGDSFGYRANATGISWGVSLTTDKFGFRYDPQQKPLPKAVPSIVILGDSVPNGIGVEASLTLSTLLTNRLQKRVINTSVTLYSIHDYENVVRYFVVPKRAELNIERAVLFVTLNDLDGLGGNLAIQHYLKQQDRPSKAPMLEKPFKVRLAERVNEAFNFNIWLVQRSKLYLLLRSVSYDSSKAWFLKDLERFHNLAVLKEFSERLRAIKTALDVAGIPLLVVILPYEYQLRQPTTENLFPQEVLGKILNEGGFNFLDMRWRFQAAQKQKSLRSSDFFLFNDHCHLSAAGHALVAEVLADAGSSRLLGPWASTPSQPPQLTDNRDGSGTALRYRL